MLAPHGLPGHLVGFVEALRKRGISVGPSETVDAGRVLAVLDLLDREAVREGLACALLRRPTHRGVFDALFDLWFPVASGTRDSGQIDTALPRTETGEVDIDALRELIVELLSDDSAEAAELTQMLAAQMVEELGQYKSSNGPSFSAYQALRDVAPDTLLRKILDGLLGRSDDAPDRPTDDYESEVAKRTAAQRIADLRKMVESETRRRSAEKLGRDRVASYGVPKLAEEVDFLRASDAEMVALRRNVAPLARLLASRLAVRRSRSRHGSIDLRRTLRKSMSTGGIPIDLVERKPRRARPELVVLCDVSGSVAGFSNFTLLLVLCVRRLHRRGDAVLRFRGRPRGSHEPDRAGSGPRDLRRSFGLRACPDDVRREVRAGHHQPQFGSRSGRCPDELSRTEAAGVGPNRLGGQARLLAQPRAQISVGIR